MDRYVGLYDFCYSCLNLSDIRLKLYNSTAKPNLTTAGTITSGLFALSIGPPFFINSGFSRVGKFHLPFPQFTVHTTLHILFFTCSSLSSSMPGHSNAANQEGPVGHEQRPSEKILRLGEFPSFHTFSFSFISLSPLQPKNTRRKRIQNVELLSGPSCARRRKKLCNRRLPNANRVT